MKNDKNFFFTLVFSFAILVLAVAVFNYIFDFGRIFPRRQFYEKAIHCRLQGKYLTMAYRNCDYRILNEKVVQSVPLPDVIVLGSSRMNCIQKQTFKGKSFMNNWM